VSVSLILPHSSSFFLIITVHIPLYITHMSAWGKNDLLHTPRIFEKKKRTKETAIATASIRRAQQCNRKALIETNIYSMAEETKKKIIEFSDSDSDSENELPNKSSLKINKSFASEFEKRKRREELINAKHNDEYFSDDDSSSDESEDEDAELLTAKVDLQILKVSFLFIPKRCTQHHACHNTDNNSFVSIFADNQCTKE